MGPGVVFNRFVTKCVYPVSIPLLYDFAPDVVDCFGHECVAEMMMCQF